MTGRCPKEHSELDISAFNIYLHGLQSHSLACNLATLQRCIRLPEAMADWSLTSLQLKLIKIGARVVRHARAITFQLAEAGGHRPDGASHPHRNPPITGAAIMRMILKLPTRTKVARQVCPTR